MKKRVLSALLAAMLVASLAGCGSAEAEEGPAEIDAIQFTVGQWPGTPKSPDEAVYTSDPDAVKEVVDLFDGLEFEEYASHSEYCDEIDDYLGLASYFVDFISGGRVVKRYTIYTTMTKCIQFEPHGQVYSFASSDDFSKAMGLLEGLTSDAAGVPPADLDSAANGVLAQADSVHIVSAQHIGVGDGDISQRYDEETYDITDAEDVNDFAALFSDLEYLEYAGADDFWAEQKTCRDYVLEFMSGGEIVAQYTLVQCDPFFYVLPDPDGKYCVLTDVSQNYWLYEYITLMRGGTP